MPTAFANAIAPSSASSFSFSSNVSKVGHVRSKRVIGATPSGVTSFNPKVNRHNFVARPFSAAQTSRTPASVSPVSLKLRSSKSICFASARASGSPALYVNGLSLRSSDTSPRAVFRIAVASAIAPSAPTRHDAIRKCCSFGDRAIIAAICFAPSSPLILLYN